MNRELAKAQERVEKIALPLQDKLGLSAWWQITHIFSESAAGAEATGIDGVATVERTTACTVVRWPYREAEITWYLPSVAIAEDKRIARVAIHEFIHILNAPLAEFLFDYLRDDESTAEQIRTVGHYMKLGEYVTETLARVVERALNDDLDAPA